MRFAQPRGQMIGFQIRILVTENVFIEGSTSQWVCSTEKS